MLTTRVSRGFLVAFSNTNTFFFSVTEFRKRQLYFCTDVIIWFDFSISRPFFDLMQKIICKQMRNKTWYNTTRPFLRLSVFVSAISGNREKIFFTQKDFFITFGPPSETHVNSCQKGLEILLACVKPDMMRWHLCLHLMIISKTCLEFLKTKCNSQVASLKPHCVFLAKRLNGSAFVHTESSCGLAFNMTISSLLKPSFS